MKRFPAFAVLLFGFALTGCMQTTEATTPKTRPADHANATQILGCVLSPEAIAATGNPANGPVITAGFQVVLLKVEMQGQGVVWGMTRDGQRTEAVGTPIASTATQTVIGNWDHRDDRSLPVTLVSVFTDGALLMSFDTGNDTHVTYPGQCADLEVS